MICSTIRPAYKISVLYLQNQASYSHFSLVNVLRNLNFTKYWNPEISLKFWDFGPNFCVWPLNIQTNKCYLATWGQLAFELLWKTNKQCKYAVSPNNLNLFQRVSLLRLKVVAHKKTLRVKYFYHLGLTAKLKIWQVPACKMEPRCDIIMMKPPTRL